MHLNQRFPWRKANNKDKVIRHVLTLVQRELAVINHEEVRRLDDQTTVDHQQLECAFVSICTLSRIRERIARLQMSTQAFDPDEVVGQLQELAVEVTRTIAAQSRCLQSASACATLTDVAGLLHRAEARIVPLLTHRESAVVQCVLLPSDLLYQYHCSLFPAERMFVIAGCRYGDNLLRLGATFDVTGTGSDTNLAHVRADPVKLGRALRAMDFSGTELGAWVHSHPGQGIAATMPSPTDTKQHQDWIRDYSPNLLSFIMVSDGYIRFFGSAIERGQLALCIQGKGITQEDDYVYRLTQA